MSVIKLSDLDFDSNDVDSLIEKEKKDALNDIRETRRVLGNMTLRDSMEAIYGTTYTNRVLGPDGGNDILIEEMNPLDDLRENSGMDRQDIGGNRLPLNTDMAPDEKAAVVESLIEQIRVADQGVADSIDEWFEKDSKLFREQHGEDAEYPVDKDQLIKLLVEELEREKKK